MFCANVGSKTPVSFLFLIVRHMYVKTVLNVYYKSFFYDKLIERVAIFEDRFISIRYLSIRKNPTKFSKIV